MTPEQAREALWRVGDLSYLLHETQETMRRAIATSIALLFVLNCARRLGKSFLCCVLAIEMCLQKKGARVLYIAPTAKQVRTIITPIMRVVLADAPLDLRPDFNTMDGIWRFPNGSEIHVVGVNNGHADDARGGSADLVIMDEAGMIDDLAYLVESVVKPMLLTTNGRIVMPSTPAPTPAHPFTEYCARAEAANSYAKFTIYDAPHIDRARAEAFIEEGGGRESSSVRREYFCEHVVDTALAVYPEFNDGLIEARERPAFFVPAIVGDAGFNDFTFVVGVYYDFRNAVDVVDWEVVGSKQLAKDTDASVSAAATEHWGASLAAAARRHIDAPPQSVAELNWNTTREAAVVAEALGRPLPLVHAGWAGIAKTETDGPFMEAAVNATRTRMQNRGLRIHPRCTKTIAHCRYGVWKTPGRDFARMDGFGHFDGAAAMAYRERCVDRTTNPYPAQIRSIDRFTFAPSDDSEREQLRRLASGARGRSR